MNSRRYTNIHLLLAACIGAALGYGLSGAVNPVQPGSPALPAQLPASASTTAPTGAPVDIEQLRKDLSTRFIGDLRTLGEKLADFVAENAIAQAIPLACKVIVDLAENPDALSNQELEELYLNQTDPELKRVVAQVLSLRGDNRALETYVSDLQPGLLSDDPSARRAALHALAKTHFASAANGLTPLLQDQDTSVKLEALLALRATGNESHIQALEPLLGDPDPSVSWLAHDALGQLQYLSKKARTRLVLADISAELPPLTLP